MRLIDVAIVLLTIILIGMMVALPFYISASVTPAVQPQLQGSFDVLSQASVGITLDAQFSPTLIDPGVNFGSVDPGFNDNEAQGNCPGGWSENPGAQNTCTPGIGSGYWVESTSNSNTDMEVCLLYDHMLTETSFPTIVFNPTDETFDFDTTADGPSVTNEQFIADDPDTTPADLVPPFDYVTGSGAIAASGAMSPSSFTYYRFWLDVAGVPPQDVGIYNNHLHFIFTADNDPASIECNV